MAKKPVKAKVPRVDSGKALFALKDNLGHIASALSGLQEIATLSLIAQYGTDDDRARIMDYLMRKVDIFDE